jgi:hypothetical protein
MNKEREPMPVAAEGLLPEAMGLNPTVPIEAQLRRGQC